MFTSTTFPMWFFLNFIETFEQKNYDVKIFKKYKKKSKVCICF